jgi:hypothetical protein
MGAAHRLYDKYFQVDPALLFRFLVRPGDTVFDLGGTDRVNLAALVGAEGRVVAISYGATTIDQLSEQHRPPRFIFVGHEVKALVGARRTLSDARPILYCGVAPDGDLIEEQGYRAFDPTGWRLPELGLRQGHHAQWLLLPEERVAIVESLRWRYLMARLLPRTR